MFGKVSKAGSASLKATGQAHDGDTFRLNTGQNARLYGVDAFELDQEGRKGGQMLPLGRDARDYLEANISPSSNVEATGGFTYGRPVTSLETRGNDVARGLIYTGNGLAAPQYLQGDARLGAYMETERLARLNRRGAHASQFQDPADHRAGKPDPWAQAQLGEYGNADALFFDDATPFQGLRPEIAKGYLAVVSDPSSTAEDIKAYAARNGFQIDESDIADFLSDRAKPGVTVEQSIPYKQLPRVITDPGDGIVGAAGRGLADPINMLDEMGGLVDSLGLTEGRENIWDSDRRFGDVLWNNIDQNRAILAYDDQNHPVARFGGQLASGLAIPGASMQGVGLAAARKVLQAGGTRLAAKEAAEAAVRSRLASGGAVEGGLAGFGAGEGSSLDRLPGAGVGAAAGGALGYGSAALTQALGPVGRSAIDRVRGRKATETVLDQAPGLGVDETVGAVPVRGLEAPSATPPHLLEMASAGADVVPSISSPRVVDRINDRARPMLDPASDMQRMARAERVHPTDVLPLPSNVVASIDEAVGIAKGMYAPVKPLNEADELAARSVPSPVDSTRTLPKRGPLDLLTFLRTRGGMIDQRGELRAMGIDNAGRDLDFAKGEQRFGKLVDDERGMTLEDAARVAWEEGYFPDHVERPTISEFLDTVNNTNRGVSRAFRPDDLEEVDAFNAARGQRLSVEKARDDGAPLVADRSEPATLDDIEANAPPVSAYEEWGENAPDFAGNIRLGNLDSPQNIKRALAVTDQRAGGFDAARRGRIRQAETQSLADDLGMTPAQLLSRRKGQAFNAEEALAARQILAKSGNELVNIARRLQREERPGDEALAAFRQAWVRHVAIQEQIAGATAEAGRALAQFRMMADGRRVRGSVLSSLLEGSGGGDRLKKAADIIIEHSDTLGRMNRQAEKMMRPKWLDKVNEYWINSLLSGPQTHVVNLLSNTMTGLAQIPEHALAAGIGGVRNAAGRGKVVDRVLFSELGARSIGLLQGAREGLRQAGRTFRTGESSDFGGKVETRTQDAIGGVAGKVIRTPTRLLSASDELFKGMARRMELAGLSIRKADAEGLTGEEAKLRAGELLANPTDEMLDQAFDYGRYVTFQRPLGSFGRFVSAATNSAPGLKFVIPFVRTPTNLLKFAIERSPAAPLLGEVRAEFKAGGARRDLALARVMAGTGVGALVAQLASQGLVTGDGPADEKARALLQADGWQPYSIKIGNKYISYQRLDPFATTMGVAANLVDLQSHMTEKQQEDIATLLVASVIKNMSDKTWLSGLSDAIEAAKEPERSAGTFIKKLVASATVPAGIAQVARTVDPTLREAEGILNAVRARIPGMSKSLPPRRDMWGQPITGEGGLGPDILSPIWQSTRGNGAVNNALLDQGLRVPGFARSKDMTAQQYGQFREEAGALSYNGIQQLVGSPGWTELPLEDRQAEIDGLVRVSRKQAKTGLFGHVATSKAEGAAWPGVPVQ
ncbi:hypothetical protein WG908_06355 [Sphingobium sp. AN641]|uniref:thermonuclease family protein n=1 Tax=Sphingobium sp. AN641 TaxID=3133443 RepID=UPI0030BBFD6A